METKITKKGFLILIILLLGVLLFLRSISNVFIYPLTLVAMIAIMFCPVKVCLPLLFFLLPFASIIKFQPGQISLFTAFFAIYAIRVVFKKGFLTRDFLISIVFFAVYSFLFIGFDKFITIATMICGFVMLKDSTSSNDYSYEEMVYSFSVGSILASFIGMLKGSLPIIDNLVLDDVLKVDQNEYVERFLALNSNSNYFSMDISIILACLLVIILYKRKKILQLFMFASLTIFGMMSASKSFLISLILLLCFFIFCSIKAGKSGLKTLVLVILLLGIFVCTFGLNSIETYLFRLESDSTGNLSDITTGRSDLFYIYVKEIAREIKNILFGKGFENFISGLHAPHNTYIEAVYDVGIVGVLIYCYALKKSVNFSTKPKEWCFYIPLIILLVRLFGISMFTHDSLWYYYVLVAMTIKSYTKIHVCNKYVIEN